MIIRFPEFEVRGIEEKPFVRVEGMTIEKALHSTEFAELMAAEYAWMLILYKSLLENFTDDTLLDYQGLQDAVKLLGGTPYPLSPQFFADNWFMRLSQLMQDDPPVGILEDPISVGLLRGIRVNCVATTQLKRYFPIRTINLLGSLWFEATFTPAQAPPAMRGIGTPTAVGIPFDLTIAGVFGAGYSNVGVYNGSIGIIVEVLPGYGSTNTFYVRPLMKASKGGGIDINAPPPPPEPLPVPTVPPIPPEPAPPEVGFTHAFNGIIFLFRSMAEWFYEAAEKVARIPLLGSLLADPLWWAGNRCEGISNAFINVRDLIDIEVLPILRVVLTPDNILHYLGEWWEATAQPWVESALEWALTNLGIKAVVKAWSTFWNDIWPEWTREWDIILVKWDFFWKVTLPGLLTWQWLTDWWSGRLLDINSLITSAFTLREDFWRGWSDFRDQVAELFEDPEDWLLKRIESMIERFW